MFQIFMQIVSDLYLKDIILLSCLVYTLKMKNEGWTVDSSAIEDVTVSTYVSSVSISI